MTNIKTSSRSRGRPRTFDLDDALIKAQALFHERGYDAVGVAALTEAIGISPPSFYAAFGSKAALFDQVLERYAGSALPLGDILQPGRNASEALADLLSTAADMYSASRATAGCLVLESARATLDDGCANAARRYRRMTHDRVRDFLSISHPEKAEALADFVDATLSGLSACAREGWEKDRLVAVAGMAADALAHRLGT